VPRELFQSALAWSELIRTRTPVFTLRIPKAISNVIESFERLPGIGPKTARRLTFYLLRLPDEYLSSFAQALSELKTKTVICSRCYRVGESDPCEVCIDPGRDHTTICVVEDPLDTLVLDRAGYQGLYHVLHGVISPLNNVGPEDLYLKELRPRLESGEVTEIILATNPTMEGEATAMYLKEMIRGLPVKVTRLGRGLPVGGDLEYTDATTIKRSIESRSEIT